MTTDTPRCGTTRREALRFARSAGLGIATVLLPSSAAAASTEEDLGGLALLTVTSVTLTTCTDGPGQRGIWVVVPDETNVLADYRLSVSGDLAGPWWIQVNAATDAPGSTRYDFLDIDSTECADFVSGTAKVRLGYFGPETYSAGYETRQPTAVSGLLTVTDGRPS